MLLFSFLLHGMMQQGNEWNSRKKLCSIVSPSCLIQHNFFKKYQVNEDEVAFQMLMDSDSYHLHVSMVQYLGVMGIASPEKSRGPQVPILELK